MSEASPARFEALRPHVRFGADGLVVAVVQDAVRRDVLMVAYQDEAALRETLALGEMVYWSRSRRARWRKGETSGHVQRVRAVRVDCDGDALLYEVEQVGGAACHTGHHSCFYRAVEEGAVQETEPPVVAPETLYGH